MKHITTGVILFLLFTLGLKANQIKTNISTQEVQIFTAENSNGKITAETIEKAFEQNGFFISEHKDMNAIFLKEFKKTSFKTYSLLTVYKKDIVRNLAAKYSNIGLFTPMSMSIYSKEGENTISVAFLSAGASARMMGIPEENKEIVKLGKSMITALHVALPHGRLEKVSYLTSEARGNFISRASFVVGEKLDVEEVKNDFQILFERELLSHGFSIAGFTELGDDFEGHGIDTYHYYDTYSICKLKTIYVVAQKYPESGAFAPCRLYMYQKSDENKMSIAFPTVHKWINTLGIEDEESISILMDSQKSLEMILEKLTEAREGSKW